MKRSIILLAFVILSFSFYSVSAISGCLTEFNINTTSELVLEIPSINSALSDCPVSVPAQFQKFVKDDIFLLEIIDDEDIIVEISGGNFTSVRIFSDEDYSYKIKLSSCQIDNILANPEAAGAFATYYLNGQADLQAKGFGNKVKLWFGKIFMKSALKKMQMPVEECSN